LSTLPFLADDGGMLRWKKVYDRTTVLDKADRARGRGSVRKAIRGYTTILQNDPTDHQVHARVAPLLARTRRWDDARKSFDAAGAGFLKQGFADKAIAVWTSAAQHFPEDVEYWERIANEQLRRGRRADAVNALLQGRLQFRARRQRATAVMLLRQVLAVDAFHFEGTIDLCSLLSKEGAGGKAEAERLLRCLERWVTQRTLRRRLRLAQLRLAPSFQRAMAWATAS
jgi:tetratricopeptide (TPR) repeat protein